ETRRILGEYVLCREDYLARRSFPDEIGRYNFPADIHPAHPTREMLEEHKRCFRDEGYKTGESYGIPYRSLIPRHTGNLLVCGRCISCDRYVFASIRVIPGCFITGQAAGFAAALCMEHKCSPKSLDPNKLRATMAEHQALLQ
ncbi:MAG: FAD-dependent oxidoreductase, partial [Victivallales bacterium]|nr:FAD-dependent oxidoreductase [Victivallales bacterium]